MVTTATVAAMLLALTATLLGSAGPESALAGFDASAWLWSSPKGEMARVNGVTGRVDTRYKLVDASGRQMQVAQTDRYVILRDITTGRISVIDLASLHVTATTETAPGAGITVALTDGVAFVVDGVQGLIRQMDPATLAPIGQPLRFPPGLTGGSFDAAGRLWLLVPSEGTVAVVKPATGNQPEPRVVRTVAVTDPAHDVALTVLDDGAAVLDNTSSALVVVRAEGPRRIPLTLTGPATVPARTTGGRIPVTVAEDRRMYIVTGDAVATADIPGSGPRLAACTAWSGRFYCPDEGNATVYVIDGAGRATAPIAVPNPGGPLELEVREQHLFINAPGSSTARVVDSQHRVKVVDKYASNIAGADPPPAPPPQPPPKPVVSVPNAPGRVVAVAGNAQARLTWTPATPNGAPILRYVVEGGGRPIEVGANQRAADVTGLTNGKEYRFTVHAVNAKGSGPKRAANPVVPTAEVPDPPASVTAEARPDGTVLVAWSPANGQGRKVVRYQVTAVTRGSSAAAGESDSPTFVVPAGGLTYGTQYAFTVIAVNDRGASSAPSPVSNTVTPYTRPGPPRNVRAVTVNQRGTIDVSWQPADDNGRAIDHYVVTAGAQKTQVKGTSVTLTGFGDGQTVQVSVLAVNAAGDGPAVQRTARTIDVPRVSVTGTSVGYTSITVNFAVADGGSPPTCTLTIAGGGQASGNCTTLTAGGVWPGRGYGWTLTVTNAAGSVTASGNATTRVLNGTVLCNTPSYCGRGAPNGGIWVYRTPSQRGSAVDDVFSPEQYDAVCQVRDTGNLTINAVPYGGKSSNMWVRIKFPAGQENYIPWAWFRLAEGDNLGLLPGC